MWAERSRLALGAPGVPVAGTDFTVVVLLITDVVLSEPLSMALMLPTLLVAEPAVEVGEVRAATAAGAPIGVLAFVRMVGLFLLPAPLAVMVARRRWRSAVAPGAAAMALIASWQAWLSQGDARGGRAIVKTVVARNANELIGFLGYITRPSQSGAARLLSLGSVLAVPSVGAFVSRRRLPVMLVCLVGYAAVILRWRFEPIRGGACRSS